MTGASACGWGPAALAGGVHPALADPWNAAVGMGAGTVLALLTATQGPSYRDLGTAMMIGANGQVAGAITSGCVEADLILQADTVRREGRVQRLHYGQGSPFFDMKLPCGGGIEVTLFPVNDPEALSSLAARRAARDRVAMRVSSLGRMTVMPFVETGPIADGFAVGFQPPVRYVIIGAGAEALVFAGLVARLGYDHVLLSHDDVTLNSALGLGCRAERLGRMSDLASVGIDARTAVTLFYHDHDYEPEILRELLQTPAFYIGAQGSRAAQATRRTRLLALGASPADIARLRGPIGMIPSTRDAQSLGISVLAEITAAALQATVPAQAVLRQV